MAHPDVAEAASFGAPHATLGEEVRAAVVLRPNGTISAEDLKTFLSSRIADYKIPRTIHFVTSLPRTPSHKLRRHALCEELGLVPPASPPPPPTDGSGPGATHSSYCPRTPEGIVLEKLWRKLLKAEVVHADDAFFDQGGDSLTAMTLLAELEAQCGVLLSPAILVAHPTIAGLEDALLAGGRVPPRTQSAPETDENTRATLGRLRTATSGWQGTRAHSEALLIGRNLSGNAKPIFFCFDAAPAFYQLAEALGADQPVYALRSPWRIDDRQHVVRALAVACCDELLTRQPRGPYILGGYCQGAVVAQRMASELLKRGARVQTCLLVDPIDLEPAACSAGLILTSFGRLSLYQYYKRPEIGLRKLFQGGFNIYRHHCEHQDLFEEPDVARTAQYMREEIARSSAGICEYAGHRTLSLLADGAHRHAIRAAIPGRIRRNSRHVLQVTVTNTSTTTWPANQISVCNRWPSFKTAAIRWLKKNHHSTDRVDGSTLVPTEVKPGESVTLELRIRAPSSPRLAKLELDLVEEGICWFQEKPDCPPLRENIVVF
jgi:aryl carrier-like protein